MDIGKTRVMTKVSVETMGAEVGAEAWAQKS